MRWQGCLYLLVILSFGSWNVYGQPNVSISKKTRLTEPGSKTTVQTTNGQTLTKFQSLTFTASTDQRFFFFGDTRNDNGRRIPVSVYGVRAGYYFPATHDRPALHDGRNASYKTGAGFYFINQRLDQPGLIPGTYEPVTRHLRIVTLFYERYLYRKGPFEVSLPLEAGYGHSRYERNEENSPDYEVARGTFLPVGVGAIAAYHFPTIRWLRPLSWFGANVLVGYRFILKKDIPDSQINYSGLYLSVGPSFYLENLTADIRRWQQRHRAKKAKS